jgi:ribonuclease D
VWIRTSEDLGRLADELAAVEEIALDTEGDSLHHYPARLALIQVADVAGRAWLVDPLAIGDLAPLAPLFARARPLLVLHAGDNDLLLLKRRYGFAFGAVFDTSLAARFLGARALGLDVLLETYIAVTLPPSRQKDDWSARPLTEAQERYAIADVAYLIPLKDHLRAELARVGRLAWVEEECAALAAEIVPDPPPEPDAYLGVKGARQLAPRALAILRELYATREELALAADRPPFKVLGEETLLRLTLAAPGDEAALATVPGCTPRVIGRWGPAILAALARARAVPESELTGPTPAPHGRPLSAAARRRIEAMRRWRGEAAPRVGLDPGVLLPNRLIRAIAEAGPSDVEALGRVQGVRRWRVEAFGAEILRAVALG